jgi:hypothetical protein
VVEEWTEEAEEWIQVVLEIWIEELIISELEEAHLVISMDQMAEVVIAIMMMITDH